MSTLKVFMKVVNGRPIDHPQSEYGMKILFPPEEYPQYDYNTVLPPEYYPLEMLPRPHITCYEKLGLTYEFVGDRVRDVWSVTPMNEQERVVRLAEMEAIKPYPSWTLNEYDSQWEAPVAKPTDGQEYVWNETDQIWVVETQ